MNKVACKECGLLNWKSMESCEHCGAKDKKYGLLWHLGISSLGLFVLLITIPISPLVKGHVSLFLGIVLASLGLLFSYLYPTRRWQLGISLALPYTLLMAYSIKTTMTDNAQWEGVFWRTEIFYSTVYLYMSVVISTCLGVVIGSTRSFYGIALLGGVLLLTFVSEQYILDHPPIEKSTSASFDLINNEDLWLRADIRCSYEINKDYLGFRNYDRGGCGDSRIKVLRKNPKYNLATTATWVIEGKETVQSMWPINGPGDSSIVRNFESGAYNNISEWRTTIPVMEIANAHQGEFRWDDISLQFQEEQFKALNDLLRKYKQLVEE
jgi:hypothetical protein